MPSELPYEDVDLCSLMGNLLDNAVEACERMPAGMGPCAPGGHSVRKPKLFCDYPQYGPWGFAGRTAKRDTVRMGMG